MMRTLLPTTVLVLLFATASGAQLPAGYEIIQITDDSDNNNRARINNCGEIVFSKRIDLSDDLEEIFVYTNGGLVRITHNTVRDAFPDINDAGTLVWTQNADGFGGGEIVMWRGGVLTELAPGFRPRINNLDHVTWWRFNEQGCSGADIFFYDGRGVRQITFDDYSNVSQSMNDLDQIVWSQRDLCLNPADGEIVRYAAGEITQLTTDQFQPQQAEINNIGQVVWTYDQGLGSEFDWIELWEAGSTSVITEWGINPELNDWGEISFLRWHDDINRWQVWLYRDGDFFRLSPNPKHTDTACDINNAGEVVMQSGLVPTGDILLMRRTRTGDFDFDGDVDLDDHASLAGCLTGPSYTGRVCACRFLDFDDDADIDLQDFARFQTAFAPSAAGLKG